MILNFLRLTCFSCGLCGSATWLDAMQVNRDFLVLGKDLKHGEIRFLDLNTQLQVCILSRSP